MDVKKKSQWPSWMTSTNFTRPPDDRLQQVAPVDELEQEEEPMALLDDVHEFHEVGMRWKLLEHARLAPEFLYLAGHVDEEAQLAQVYRLGRELGGIAFALAGVHYGESAAP